MPEPEVQLPAATPESLASDTPESAPRLIRRVKNALVRGTAPDSSSVQGGTAASTGERPTSNVGRVDSDSRVGNPNVLSAVSDLIEDVHGQRSEADLSMLADAIIGNKETQAEILKAERAKLEEAANRFGYSPDLLHNSQFVDALHGVISAEETYFGEALKVRGLQDELDASSVALPALHTLLVARREVLSQFPKMPGQGNEESQSVTTAEPLGDPDATDIAAADTSKVLAGAKP